MVEGITVFFLGLSVLFIVIAAFLLRVDLDLPLDLF